MRRIKMSELCSLEVINLCGGERLGYPSDFEIDLDLANAFFQKLQTAMPDNVALAMSPMKLDSIDFNSNNASDVNIIAKAYENIINANGGIVLNQNKITNSASFKLASDYIYIIPN